MRTRFVFIVLLLSPLAIRAEVDASRDTMPKKFQGAPGLIKGGFLIEGSKKRFAGANELNLASFTAKLEVSPGELSLKRIHDPQPDDQVTLRFTITNGADQGTFLYFPTAQRCEAQIRDAQGKVVYTWSEDFEFAADSGYSFLNPRERLNYQLIIPLQVLRGKIAAGPAVLTANLFNYPQVRGEMPLQIVP